MGSPSDIRASLQQINLPLQVELIMGTWHMSSVLLSSGRSGP